MHMNRLSLFMKNYDKSILVRTQRRSFATSAVSSNIYVHNVAHCRINPEEFGVRVIPNFITEEEHDNLVKEVDPGMMRRKYQVSHWDKVITGYREIEKWNWEPHNVKTISKVKVFLPSSIQWMPGAHVLDLAEEGMIGPHVDSIKFSGDYICGLSLLSPSIMRLRYEAENNPKFPSTLHFDKDDLKKVVIDLFIEPRSLYIIRNCARYNFTHEIPSSEDKSLETSQLPPFKKVRRIAVIIRDEPINPPS